MSNKISINSVVFRRLVSRVPNIHHSNCRVKPVENTDRKSAMAEDSPDIRSIEIYLVSLVAVALDH